MNQNISVEKISQEKFDQVCENFKKNGGRITEQRKDLIRIILGNPNSSSKEIYYLAHQSNKNISRATVYRTINSMVEMGYISYRLISVI